MSAQRLRDAAKVLRERAKDATPGPWIAEYSKKSGHCVIDAESRNALDSVARATHFRDVGDATYIALMHPGVALALAQVLESLAFDREVNDEIDGRTWSELLTVADQILGTQS